MRHLNKKGGVFDVIIAIIFSFILVVVCVLMVFAQNQTFDKLKEVAPSMQSIFTNESEHNVSQIINDTVGQTSVAYSTLPWITVMLIFGFFMSVLISAFLVKTHPVFFVAYIFISIIAIIISVYISNAYQTLMTTGMLQSTWMSFVGANFIFVYFPIWVTVIAFIAGLLMYANIMVN
jgi:hypothetical protein